MFKFRQKESKRDKQQFTWREVGVIGLRTMKLLSNFFYIFLLLFFMLGLGTAFGYLGSQVEHVQVPSKDSLLSQVNAFTQISKMTYSDGSLIADIDTDLLRLPVESEAISDTIKQAIVATEDENFSKHQGAVPKAIFRATLGSVLGFGESSGGSTLTQQLIKQQILGDDPTFSRKSKEIIYALALERYATKDDILTAYLNVSPFGRNFQGKNIAGVEAAAQGIFGRSASELTIPQAAFLAGLPQSPIVYSPYNADGTFKSDEAMVIGIQRSQNVLYNMYRAGMLSSSDYEKYKNIDIKSEFRQPEQVVASGHDYLYYSVFEEAEGILYDYLMASDRVSEIDQKNDDVKAAYHQKATQALRLGGYSVSTTINKGIFEAMQTAAAQYGGFLDDGTGRVEMGNVLMDNQTGAILGFVGGRDYATNQNNHAFDTERSPGSSIKPVLAYAPAIDQGLMGSASVLSNYPTTYSSGETIMHVDSKGTAAMNLQEALNMSWNIPAFWTYKLLQANGVSAQSYMEKMGYTIPDYSIESLPMGGGSDMTVAQQTNGYQTLANNGQYHRKHMVDKITARDGTVIYHYDKTPTQVYSVAAANIMIDMLRGVITSGATTPFLSNMRAINPTIASADWVGKTGTSNNYADAWLVLSTPTITLGSWTGHDDNTPMSTTSANNNAQYVAYLINSIAQVDSSIFGVGTRFGLDSSVIKSTVLKSTGQAPGAVTVNGKTISLSGETVTSYWAKGGAPVTNYQFMIGGSEADRQSAWAAILGSVSKYNNAKENTKAENSTPNNEDIKIDEDNMTDTNNTSNKDGKND